MKFLIRICAAPVVVLGLLSGNACAQNFPTKPIRIVIPFAPGGQQDLIVRPIAQKLTEALGQPVVVDYKAGGTAIIGSEFVAKSPADGHTLLSFSGPHSTNPSTQKSLPYDTLKDFASVSPMCRGDVVLISSPRFPANNLTELIALAKQRPGQLNFASSGIGGSMHLVGELLKITANVDMTHVPYKGTGPIMVDVMSGTADLTFIAAPAAVQQIKDGKVKLLAAAGSKRSALFPDTPTVAESGYPQFESSSAYGLAGPAGMPRAVINRLNGAMEKILATAEIQQGFAKLGLEAWWMPADQLQAWLREDIERWNRVAKAIKFQPE